MAYVLVSPSFTGRRSQVPCQYVNAVLLDMQYDAHECEGLQPDRPVAVGADH